MSHELRKKIQSLRTRGQRIAPDKAWISYTRGILIMQIKNALPVEQMSFWRRSREAVRMLITSKMSQVIRKPVMATLSILAVVLSGSIFTVSAAERSLPGDFFYGIKLVTEQARLALTSTKEDKLILKTEFTDRRVSELKQVASNPDSGEQVKQVAEMLKRDLSTIKDQLADVKQGSGSEKVVAAAKLVDKKSSEVINALQETKSGLSPETKEKVTEAQSAAADNGVKAIEVLAEKHQESSDMVTAIDVVQAIQDHTKAVTDATPFALGMQTTSSTTSTANLISESISTSTVFTSSTLPAIVVNVKNLTTQAFAIQKAQDQKEADVASMTEAITTSTEDGIEDATTTNDGSASSTSSTVSNSPSATDTSNKTSSTSGVSPP